MGESVRSFEDLDVWKLSMQLVVDIYQALKDCKDFGLRDQMQRSAVSIPSNIAEGFERNTNKEFIHFLFIAKGSSGELRTQLYITGEVEILGKQECKKLIERCTVISRMLYKLIQTRKSSF